MMFSRLPVTVFRSVLITFWTWSALQTLTAATTTTTMFSCEPPFNDVASRTLLSSAVFQGRVTRTRTDVTQDDRHLPSSNPFDIVELSVTRVLKGAMSSESVAVIANCSLLVEVGVLYVVFAMDTSTSLSSEVTRLNTPVLYGVVGRPEPSTRRVVRQVTEYACPDCEGERPSVRIIRPRETSLDVRVDATVRLQCTGQGRPPPRYVWTKDSVLLQSSRHLHIRRLRQGSRLHIRHSTVEDGGIYRCIAVNVVDNSSATIQVNVGEGYSTPSQYSTPKPHSQLCSAQDHCLNGGTCYVMSSIGMQYCRCPVGYRGSRCEERVITPLANEIEIKHGWKVRSFSHTIVIILLSATLLTIFLAVFVTVTCRVRKRIKKNKAGGRRRNQTTEKLIHNGSVSRNAARISEYHGNDIEMTSSSIIGCSQQAPALNYWAHDLNGSSEQPVGRLHEAHNHMDMYPSPLQVRNTTPISSQPATDVQQPPSDWPITQLRTESRVPTAVTSSAGTMFQRNSSGYPIDSDPEASVV